MVENAIEILNIIDRLGYEAYIVGGFPRDKYLNICTKDIDICSNINVSVLKDNFNIIYNNFYSYVITYKGYEYQLTLFRKEYNYIKNRYPTDIELVNNLNEDLMRRDFTINTLCINKDNEYIDILNAKDDLNNKIIKCVGDTKVKLCEDSLRMLRAIRFATTLNFTLDNKIVDTIIDNKVLIKSIPTVKVKNEIAKIQNSSNKEYGYKLLKECEIYDDVI